MIELRAPAKLTWFLEITGRRGDGMHELRAEMLSVDFADRLEIEEDGDYLRLEGPYSNVVANEENLVSRALRLVDRRAGVVLHKFIPPGGGLGGGSSDAGAILRWAGVSGTTRRSRWAATFRSARSGGEPSLKGWVSDSVSCPMRNAT